MIDERRAVEALRAGVPNKAAIRLLGTTETEIRDRFLANLNECRRGLREDRQVHGQIVAGAFGAGKSHLLGYLQELALQENYIVSWVAISKETPLFDAGKLYLSAMRSAVVPNRNDDAMTAVIERLKPNNDGYDELEKWTFAAPGLPQLFPALLHLIPRQQMTPERLQQVARFLAGGKLGVAQVNQWLREGGAAKLFQVRAVRESELTRHRLRFVPRLMVAAGYAGWCLLLDEVELIGRYGPLQRGRSYAALARWLGLDSGSAVPGVVTVAAVTDDFYDVMIGQRRDDELVPRRLLDRGERDTATLAEVCLRALEQDRVLLRSPDDAILRASYEKTRRLYGSAYDWTPPDGPIERTTATGSMRQYIKSWITAWDLKRLYGETVEIEAGTVPLNYEENTTIEMSSGGADDENGPAK